MLKSMRSWLFEKLTDLLVLFFPSIVPGVPTQVTVPVSRSRRDQELVDVLMKRQFEEEQHRAWASGGNVHTVLLGRDLHIVGSFENSSVGGLSCDGITVCATPFHISLGCVLSMNSRHVTCQECRLKRDQEKYRALMVAKA